MSDTDTLPIIQFGAGAIGRGFLAELWFEAGHKIIFVDMKPDVVGELQMARSYPLFLVGAKKPRLVWINDFIAVGAPDIGTIAWHMARCAFAATAVGVRALASLAPTIAAGVAARAHARNADERPLNILCCENQNGAAALLREAVADLLPADPAICAYFNSSVAFVDAIVGRMVPPATGSTTIMHRLAVDAEAFKELPIDQSSWLGGIPPIAGLVPVVDFAANVERHDISQNGGHAVLGYQGHRLGYEYVWQAAEDPSIAVHLKKYWAETGAALVKKYGMSRAEQKEYETDLLRRFKNRPLADTIARVVRDVVRKVGPDDRLLKATHLCIEQDVEPAEVCRTIAAAYAFTADGDTGAATLQTAIAEHGLRAALEQYSGLAADSPLVPLIETEYNSLTGAVI